MGDVTDFSNFRGAVIDRASFAKLSGVLDRAKDDDALTVVAGGTADDCEGFFVRPTVVEGTDPGHEVFTTEYFGPILAVHVYDDADYDTVLTQMESVAPYALTGVDHRHGPGGGRARPAGLRYAAGNFYVNDKPTGAVVGQQPFGGARASGTNDKAGAAQNLMRWTSAPGRSRRRSSRRPTTATRTWTRPARAGPVPSASSTGAVGRAVRGSAARRA